MIIGSLSRFYFVIVSTLFPAFSIRVKADVILSGEEIHISESLVVGHDIDR
jgi:hypothetical protein